MKQRKRGDLMKFACLLSEGFEDTEALATTNLLRRTDLEVDLVSVFNTKTVIGARGTTVVADIMMSEMKEADYDGLFIPGGGHSYVLKDTESVKSLVAQFYEHKKWLMAICAAPIVFGTMNLLDRKRYISFPGTQEYMGQAIRVEKKVVRDGRFITGRSVGVVYDFVFEIVKTVLGEEALNKLQKRIVY